jgi:hypothetical protein
MPGLIPQLSSLSSALRTGHSGRLHAKPMNGPRRSSFLSKKERFRRRGDLQLDTSGTTKPLVRFVRLLPRTISCRSLPRRSCAAVTLVCYVLTAFGVPLPAAPVRKGSVPYPCQGRACGCMSAEQCWSGCCCMTPEERWAWARSHGVVPPDYAERPESTGQSVRPVSSHRSCCERVAPKAKGVARKPGFRWGLGAEALKCQGHSTLWVMSGAVHVTCDAAWSPHVVAMDWLGSFDDAPCLGSFPPADPPPRPAFG